MEPIQDALKEDRTWERLSSTWYTSSLGPYMTDGEKTLAENIADLIDLQKAYDAYKGNQSKNGGKDVRLPGFENTTSDELFFMRHALMHLYYTKE
ncbi:neprilysin-1-like isoform X3 [Prorops nasuta]|uniref:neprilysin-1-like isoform X3 n=1 Tax=Prorops nasuta TaxID=863751 RepID=UPI0034CF6860